MLYIFFGLCCTYSASPAPFTWCKKNLQLLFSILIVLYWTKCGTTILVKFTVCSASSMNVNLLFFLFWTALYWFYNNKFSISNSRFFLDTGFTGLTSILILKNHFSYSYHPWHCFLLELVTWFLAALLSCQGPPLLQIFFNCY